MKRREFIGGALVLSTAPALPVSSADLAIPEPSDLQMRVNLIDRDGEVLASLDMSMVSAVANTAYFGNAEFYLDPRTCDNATHVEQQVLVWGQVHTVCLQEIPHHITPGDSLVISGLGVNVS